MKTMQRARHSVEELIDRIAQGVRDQAIDTAKAPADEAAVAALEAALAEIPQPDSEILLEWKGGLRYCEIAQRKGMAEEAVLRSLARTYSQLRMRTMP